MLTSVARMYYIDGLGQSEIANICGVSRSTVSRLLSTARNRGVVRISVDDFDPRDAGLEHQLCLRFGLRRAIVIRDMGGTVANIRRTIGYFAASFVASWLAGSRTIGVAGGRAVGEVIHFMQPHTAGVDTRVVQLMGTIGSTPSRIDASELSRMMAHRFRGTCFTVNAPAFVEGVQMRDLFLSHSQIMSVRSMFPSLDTALVGIGTLEESVFVERGVLTPADLEELRQGGAVGEICGRFFDIAGWEIRSARGDRVVSIDLDVLRSGPEVIAVTNGASRRTAVLAAIEGNLIHSLVIDSGGARALLSPG